MMKEKRLYVMMGAPGSGKSFAARQLSKELNCDIVSRDDVRFGLIKEGDEYFSQENRVFDSFCWQIRSSLLGSGKCIADATHLTLASRKKLLNKIDVDDLKVTICYIKTPLSMCLERNNHRTGLRYVPESVIKRMYYSIEEPVIGELPGVDCVDITEQEVD